MTEYKHIAKQIERVRLAPHGTKGAHQKTLIKKRLASLKRELARYARRRPLAQRSA